MGINFQIISRVMSEYDKVKTYHLCFLLYTSMILKILCKITNVHGLDSISGDIEKELNMYLKLFVILYEDDTVLMSESSEDLQKQLDIMYD